MQLVTTVGTLQVVFWASFAKEPLLYALWGGAPSPGQNWPYAALTVTTGGGATFGARGAVVFRQGAWTDDFSGGAMRVNPADTAKPVQRNEVRLAILEAIEGSETSEQAVQALEGARRFRHFSLLQQHADAERELAAREKSIAELE